MNRITTANEHLETANDKILTVLTEDDYEDEFDKVLEYKDEVTGYYEADE